MRVGVEKNENRVGASTTAAGHGRCWDNKSFKIGSANAPVFPEPVCAKPITSFLWSAGGMAWIWIGVGVFQPRSSHILANVSHRPRSLKELIRIE